MNIVEQLTALKEPVPTEFLASKTLKGNRIDYIPWVHLIDLLDERVGIGQWEWKIIHQMQMGNKLAQVWELTIIGDDRSISRHASGDEEVDVNSFGSPATNTEAQCLRRCCAKFGLGLDLWRKKGSGQRTTTSRPSYSSYQRQAPQSGGRPRPARPSSSSVPSGQTGQTGQGDVEAEGFSKRPAGWKPSY